MPTPVPGVLPRPSGSVPGAAVTVRPIEPADRDQAARILYDAFAGIHDRHAFARDFPTLESALDLTSAFIAHPGIWGVVAEIDGRVAGSNFLDERGPVRGIGPITVDPAAQGRGVGRRLMQAVIDRGAGGGGLRLLQDAFNTGSLSLYASLGFDVVEPVALMGGRADLDAVAGVSVRPLVEQDVAGAERLHRRVHGYERTAELRDAIAHLDPTVAVRDGRVVAYATTLRSLGAAHAVAESDDDLLALIGAAEGELSFLLPTRQSHLLQTALAGGLRVVKPMNYMVRGEYRRPAGAWIPTVLY